MSLSQGLSALGFGHHRTLPLATSQIDQDFTVVPATILEAFIPGYSNISRFLLDAFGFDITKAVSITFIGYALFRSVEFLQDQAISLISRYATCHVTIPSDIDCYGWMMDWLADRKVGENSRSLVAQSATGKPTIMDYLAHLENHEKSVTDRNGKPAMKYDPAVGLRHYFFHQGRLFIWRRIRHSTEPMSNPMFQDTSVDGKLYCLGRSTAPIKKLLQEVLEFNEKKTAVKTVIRRPMPEKQRNMGVNPWRKAATRPSRSMDTVVLEDDQKESILKDVEEYLLDETQVWHAQRGIPYRRGYLFYGPPGTGKTSLSFALAGKFCLDVYCMSLQDPTITEEDLATLFDKLPTKCLVLLEDIDTAGVIARPKPKPSVDTNDPGSPKASPKRQPGEGNISLSGLLNIIDGVASQEGRVLIMTTNHIEKLDKALLRPGRIDVKVQFELATQAHAESLFMQIYSVAEQTLKSSDDIAEALNGKVARHEIGSMEDVRIRKMAKEFASNIPQKKLSPAEIQGFLINHKKSAEDAVMNIKVWVKGTLDSCNRG